MLPCLWKECTLRIPRKGTSLANYFSITFQCIPLTATLFYYLFRKIASKTSESDKLYLQESYLANFQMLNPYYCTVVMERLQSVYCSPLEMKYDLKFFIPCTVRELDFFFLQKANHVICNAKNLPLSCRTLLQRLFLSFLKSRLLLRTHLLGLLPCTPSWKNSFLRTITALLILLWKSSWMLAVL